MKIQLFYNFFLRQISGSDVLSRALRTKWAHNQEEKKAPLYPISLFCTLASSPYKTHSQLTQTNTRKMRFKNNFQRHVLFCNKKSQILLEDSSVSWGQNAATAECFFSCTLEPFAAGQPTEAKHNQFSPL